ncbi:NXPE family member 3-like [Aplochiton taeniatus]
MHDIKGRHRPHGGDFLVARVHSPKLLAGVAGQVLDHGNGSYSVVFPLLWEGSAQPLCNYTDVPTGEPWFCYKPKVLGCNTRLTYLQPELTGTDSVEPPMVMPSGYYFQGEWRTLSGVTVRQFKNSSSITQCLQGKVVQMFGDSTMRQWYWFLRDAAGIRGMDATNNIILKFRFHGYPILISSEVASVRELRYISNELDLLPGGSNTVVIIGVWAHFAVTPQEIYIRRLRQIRRALVLLLDRAPETVVVIRTGNLQHLDLQRCLINGDWYTLQMNRLLRAMFKGMDILLVDAWDMVLASHLPHDLHPQPPIIRNMMDHVLSYICRAKINT